MTTAWQATRAEWDRLEGITKAHVCGVCGGRLAVAKNPTAGYALALYCSTCRKYGVEPRRVSQAGILTRWLRGEAVNAHDLHTIWRQLKAKQRRAEGRNEEPDPRWAEWIAQIDAGGTVTTQQNDPNSTAVTTRAPGEIMSRDEALRFINLAKLALEPAGKAMCATIMQRTGLNPLRDEICVYEGKLMVQANGWRKILNASGTFDGMPEPPHYFTKEEREGMGKTDPDDIGVRIALKRKGQAYPVYAVGWANAKKPHRGKQPVEVLHPQIMAETRAYNRGAHMGWQDLLDGWGMASLTEDGIPLPTVAEVANNSTPVPPAEWEPPDDVQEGEFEEIGPDLSNNSTAAAEEPPREYERPHPDPLTAQQAQTIRKLGFERHQWGDVEIDTYTQGTYGKTLPELTRAEAGEVIGYLQAVKAK